VLHGAGRRHQRQQKWCVALSITRHMRSGDIIWVEHRGTKSRFKIVWVRDSESLQLIQAAVHLVERERCPWQNN
jgi:hypothetical protein